MKLNIMILAILLLFIGGCSRVQDGLTISGIQDLMLDEQELQQLGLNKDVDIQDLQQLGLSSGTNCKTDEEYSNIVDSSIGQHSFCVYNIKNLNDTQVIIELQKFANHEALYSTYQYDSSHLFGAKGLISENDYGDKSRFRVNSEDDYGAEYNEPGMYYYHLWICKDLYLIHITSGGRSKEAGEHIVNIGKTILAKFG